MKIIDISHWQGNIDWAKVAKQFKVAFMKCTESTAFLDDKFSKNKKEARENGILCGYYHFARGGDFKQEADWFLSNIGDIKEGELVALDYEIYTLADPAEWCKNWLEYVESKIGFKPLLYTYHAIINKYDWKKVSDGNFGLWVARYGLQQTEPNEKYAPAIGSWAFYAIWQYCSQGKVDGIGGNVDLNYTKMDLETLKKYGAKKQTEPQNDQPVDVVSYEENWKKILKYLGKAVGKDFGDNPNDDETKQIKEFLEDTSEIDALKETIKKQDTKINNAISALK